MRKSLVAVTACGSSDFGSAIWPTTRTSSGTCAGAGEAPSATSIRSAPHAAFQPFFHAMAPAFPLISPGLGTTDGSLGSDVRVLDYSMRVWLDQTRLTNFGLTSKDVIVAATFGIFLIPMLYVIFQRMRERVGGASRTERLPVAALSEQHPKSRLINCY